MIYCDPIISRSKEKLRDFVLDKTSLNLIIDGMDSQEVESARSLLKFAINAAYKEEDGFYEDELFSVSFEKVKCLEEEDESDSYVCPSCGTRWNDMPQELYEEIYDSYVCPSCGTRWNGIPQELHEEIYDSCNLHQGTTECECPTCAHSFLLPWSITFRYGKCKDVDPTVVLNDA
jgi:DNA-directed RNA polymerase subunit RPC12/RpoP